MKRLRVFLFGVTSLVALLAGTTDARANCAAPLTYYAQADGNTVRVHPENFGFRQCEDNVLLREDVTSGEVVQLAAYCTECPMEANLWSDEETCFSDECVRAGTYRYGFLVPYDCSPHSCGTDYYTEVTVVSTPRDCTYSDGNAPPQVVTEGAPWGDSPTICGYGYGGGCSAAPSGIRGVFGFQALALALGFALLARKRRRRSL
jgi:hypothetical protein